MENLKTQLVVIAGGPSGMSAAVQAAMDGAEVIVIEKAAITGGAANMGMGPLGIGTKYQQEQMIDVTVEKAFNMFMDYTHYNVDARLVKRYFEQSAETIEWLEDMGVEFEGAFKYFPQSEATWHIVKTGNKIGPRAAGHMNKALLNKAQELGVKVLLETAGKKILKDDEGKVCGVLAVNKDGEEFTIECKAAVIATGGAGCNPELIKEEIGVEFGKDVFNFAIPGLVGDGLKMAWEAGADHLPVRIESACDVGGGEEAGASVKNVLRQPNLLVNAFGKRVMNEEFMQNTTYLSNVANHQKDKKLFSIVDSTIVKSYVKNGVDVTSLVTPDPDVSSFTEESVFTIVDIADEDYKNDIIAKYVALPDTKLKEKALGRRMENPLYYAMAMQAVGEADVTFAGIDNTTGDVLLAGQMIIGLKEGISTVSSIGLCDIPGFEGSEGQLLAVGDSAVCTNPSAEQLADIAISACDTVKGLLDWEPRCAMVCYSTLGSGQGELIDKVKEALAIANEKRPDLDIDGEFQLDAAIVPAVAAKKVNRESKVAGKANVLIWPDLNVGNTAVKLIQQFGHADAYGPMLQGFNSIVCDCSRGAPVSEIKGNVIISAVRALGQKKN